MADVSDEQCPECEGRGVDFRGRGNNLQFRICSRYREAKHPSEEEIQKRIASERAAHYPSSGRFG